MSSKRRSASSDARRRRRQQRDRVQARSRAERERPGRWRKLLSPEAPSATPIRAAYREMLESGLEVQYAEKLQNELPDIDYAALGIAPDTVVEPADAWPILENIEHEFVSSVQQLAARRGSAEWLYWSRRLGGQFHINDLYTTGPYTELLAETLAAGDPRTATPIEGAPRFAFDLTRELLLDLLWMRHAAILLYRLHATMKRCAKGQAVQFLAGEVPYAVPDDRLEAAIHDYDQRNERTSRNLLDAVGLHHGRQSSPPTGYNVGDTVPMWHRVGLPGERRARGSVLDLRDPSPCLLEFLDLGALDPFHEAPAIQKEHVALIILLWAVWFSVIIDEPDEPVLRRRMDSLLQWGYRVGPTSEFVPLLQHATDVVLQDTSAVIPGHLKPRTADEVLALLRSLSSTTRPPTMGNPLHDTPNHTLVDAVGASHRLLETLVRPVDGAGVNFWSDQFELDVQNIVDASGWSPQGELRKLIGRTIYREDKTSLTNIDALAARGSDVILISCKSRAFTSELHAGEHGAVRELRFRTEEALAKWDEVLDFVRANPDRLPVPLPPDVKVTGLVVLPSTPFVVERSHRAKQGPLRLPPAVSSTELQLALQA